MPTRILGVEDDSSTLGKNRRITLNAQQDLRKSTINIAEKHDRITIITNLLAMPTKHTVELSSKAVYRNIEQ